MSGRIGLVSIGIVFVLALSSLSCAERDCVFDAGALRARHLVDADLVSVFRSFEERNEIKGVLKNGNLFSLKVWSCDHYGKLAYMLIGPGEGNMPESLDGQIRLLGRVVLDDGEYRLLAGAVESHPVRLSDLPVTITIPSGEFAVFQVRVGVAGEALFVEIRFYRS